MKCILDMQPARWTQAVVAVGMLLLGCTLAAPGLGAPPVVLHTFTGAHDGGFPFGGLIVDDTGTLYGTAWGGGAANANCDSLGCGVVFSISPAGQFTVMHGFQGGADGGNPSGGLIRDGSSTLYGTTERGGSSGFGTVFQIDSAGHESVLHTFLGGTGDGVGPEGALILDKAGNLYGTTNGGGTYGAGVIFKLAPSRQRAGGSPGGAATETILHSFGNGQDGAYPSYGALKADAAGNFYGTTGGGGSAGHGTVFKFSAGGMETVLHSFSGADGGAPLGGLIFGKNADLYGTTFEPGSVFRMTARGAITTLHTFKTANDGMFPESTLVADASGELVGTTLAGGAMDGGTVFKLAPGQAGQDTILLSFDPSSQPVAGLTPGKRGVYCGTTSTGGAAQKGTVFSYAP